ncbi:MAG: hypothetical protein KJ620_05795 [Candidatus Edwardsbacteria bacterium]|nr:hypothetical protein [Candidatus Edwardsbacteria bacterium]MBU1575890.1 hypothetical protein [Candidatus Edwardsbacteria bacterium]MBU2464338.1 hypothetical protein [Candidatus Edwardsbacteria bacterium]MBU2593103.1 hypothetical protein [Candidatus Edwardsbacteria bacterium]
MNRTGLRSSFLFPALGKLLIPILVGSICLSLWQIFQTTFKIAPKIQSVLALPVYLISGLSGFAILVVLPGYFVKIINQAADKNEYIFSWRELADVQNAILVPAFKILLVTVWSFLPIELYLALLVKNHGAPSPLALIFLLLFSFIYFPMALLMMAVTNKTRPSLLPSNVIEPIFKTFKRYILFLLLFWILFLLPLFALLLWPIPFIGPLASSFILLYLWTCGMHLLGSFYRKEKERLNWQ